MTPSCVRYGVASISKIDKIIGLFWEIALQKRLYSAKEISMSAVRYDLSTGLHDLTHSSIPSIPGLTSWVCGMMHSYLWHDPFTCVTWLIHICDRTHWYVWHDSLVFVTWLIHMCDTTHSYVWHDSFICVTGLIDMCAMTHDSIHMSDMTVLMCGMTHSYDTHTHAHACARTSHTHVHAHARARTHDD